MTHSIHALADLADCSDPDGPDSPGATFLWSVADAVADVRDGYDLFETADGLVPVYTHELWTTFVDLGAYNEDTYTDREDITTIARIALFQIAERLLTALVNEEEEDDDE